MMIDVVSKKLNGLKHSIEELQKLLLEDDDVKKVRISKDMGTGNSVMADANRDNINTMQPELEQMDECSNSVRSYLSKVAYMEYVIFGIVAAYILLR